jgi:hypothetical protein
MQVHTVEPLLAAAHSLQLPLDLLLLLLLLRGVRQQEWLRRRKVACTAHSKCEQCDKWSVLRIISKQAWCEQFLAAASWRSSAISIHIHFVYYSRVPAVHCGHGETVAGGLCDSAGVY